MADQDTIRVSGRGLLVSDSHHKRLLLYVKHQSAAVAFDWLAIAPSRP